jgi:hypothetical protein
VCLELELSGCGRTCSRLLEEIVRRYLARVPGRSDRLGEFFEKVERHWRKVDVEPLLEDEAMELTNAERQTCFLLSLIEERW